MTTGKYVGDQNQSVFIYESGTYLTTSGAAQWPGKVQSFDPDDNMNVVQVRMQGTATRDVTQFDPTIEDYSISVSKFVQDWRNLYFALGSEAVSGAGPFTHTLRGINNTSNANGIVNGINLPSVTWENAQITSTGSNAIRTYRGCVLDSMTITSDGEGVVSCEETWLASQNTFGSGAASAITADTTTRAWVASDFWMTLAGASVNELKGWTWTLNNNHSVDHYSNGSKTASSFTPGDREFEFVPTIDANQTWFKPLYEQYFKGGSLFNCTLNGQITPGSRTIVITMSGCRLDDMEAPTGANEKNENTLTIVPQTVTAVAVDSVARYRAF